MSEQPVVEELEDQVERTFLAWRRTALSLVGAAALIGHLVADHTGRLPVAATLVGLGAMVGYAWLTPGRLVAESALGLVLGTLLLGALALLGVLAS